MKRHTMHCWFLLGGVAVLGCGTEIPGDPEASPAPTDVVDGGSPPAESDSSEEMVQGVGFAILGDSNSDEYRADDNRGGAYRSVTFNWMEQLVIARQLDFGEWGTWGGSRRSGYSHNWARSGARATDLTDQGQAQGVATQISAGDVDFIFINIGTNDFHLVNGSYREIYDGSLSDAAVQQKVASFIGDVAVAIDLLVAAEPAQILLTTVGDPALGPATMLEFPSEAGRARVSGAIAEINSAFVELEALHTRLALVNIEVFAEALLASADETLHVDVGGVAIDLVNQGNEPHHGRLGDSSGHLGTVLNGLWANELFIRPLGEVAPFAITPLSDAEILDAAGL